MSTVQLKKVGQQWRIDQADVLTSPRVQATATAAAFAEAVKHADLQKVFMVSSTEGWAVGRLPGDVGGTVLHYQNGTWNDVPVSSEVNTPGITLTDVWMVSKDEGWAVGYQRAGDSASPVLWHYLGGTWTSTPSPTDVPMSRIFMLSKDDGWAVGLKRDWGQQGKTTSVILHLSSGAWAVSGTFDDLDLTSIFMVSPDEGWAVGAKNTQGEEHDLALHYSNGHWETVLLPGSRFYLTALSMTSPDDGWAVGLSGSRRYKNGTWEEANADLGPLHEVQMLSSSDGWATGVDSDSKSNYFARYSNDTWTRIPTPGNASVSGISIVSPTEAWAVGSRGAILHYRNGAWTLSGVSP